ncbi:MAG: hypothetical protein ACTTGW_05260 [Candidatus Cryptobacteroides sp.]
MKTKLMNWLVLLLTAGFMLAVACKGDDGATGPAGPKGEQGIAGAKGDKGDKGDKGEKGNANVKHTGWLEFDNEADWINLRPDFAFFRDNNIVFDFSEQTIKSIAAGDYITLCYVRKNNLRWVLPASIAKNDFPEFGNGCKIMNYILHAPQNGSFFDFELNVTSTDGTNVKGSDAGWWYRLVFIAVDGGAMPTKSASAGALKEELQKLSYEEVCARYDIEP